MISEVRVKEILQETGALLQGHFLLSSGLHSDQYIQCARVFQYPRYAEEICRALAEKFKPLQPDLCIGPALGGVVIAYETARALNVCGLFTERDTDGTMTLRRGFQIKPQKRVLVLEDVVTTGGSVREVIKVVEQWGGEVCGVGALVDRSNGKVDFGVPFHALMCLEINSYEPETCPLCQKGIPVVKPGSRK